MAVKPWEGLRFVSKIEIAPGPGNKEVRVLFEEEQEIGNMGGSGSYVTATFRKLHLTNETIKIHHDYPDDFKKLTVHFHGDKARAYNAYQALQCRVSDDWEDVTEEDDDDFGL